MTGFDSKRQMAMDKAMTRPVEADYNSQVAYTRALEAYCDSLAQPVQELNETAIRADEREAIAQMFEDAPALVPFAQNDKGGCMVCGFTPKLAMEAIRARGNT